MSAPPTRPAVGPVPAAPGTAPSPRRTGEAEPRWRDRPYLAFALRLIVFVLPLAGSLVSAWMMARALATPSGAGEHVLWWAGVLAASLGALLLFDRAARRLLPLAALLKLSLLFPDRAPSRLGVALRSGSTSRLRVKEIEALRRGDQEPAEAAHTIISLAASLNVHDRDTRGHSERVRAYADLIGAELDLDPADRDRLRWAALLHDLGKLTVSPSTLNSHEALSADDWESLRRHPLEGARLAAPLRSWLGPWALAIEQHHERYDGGGYPYGLAGQELSLGARIVAVADSYDAMTSPRSYSQGISAAAARRELASKAGTHFDPVIVRAFLSVALGRVRWAMGPFAPLTVLPFTPVRGGLRRTADTAGRTAALGAASLIATVTVLQPPSDLGPEASASTGAHRRPVVRVPAPAQPETATAVAAPESSSEVVEEPEPEVVEVAPAPPEMAAAVEPAATAAAVPPAPVARAPTTPAAPPPPETPAQAAAPVTATTPAAEPAPPPATECRESPSDQSQRPCQPPRWGHVEGGNPAGRANG